MSVTAHPVAAARERYYSTIAGPNPYVPASGWTIDLSSMFATLYYLELEPLTYGALYSRATQIEYALNSPSGGKAVLALVRKRYNRFSAITIGATSPPAGVTVQAALANTAAGASHTHSLTHDHPQLDSDVPNAAGAGVGTAVGGPNISLHTHAWQAAQFIGSTAGEAAHVHSDPILYDHTHSNTQSPTVLTRVAYGSENLSDTIFMIEAWGI